MIRPFAASFACFAIALVAVSGAMQNGNAVDVIGSALVAAFVFAGIGGFTGWVLDYVVSQNIRNRFEARMTWYREGIEAQTAAVQEKRAQAMAAKSEKAKKAKPQPV